MVRRLFLVAAVMAGCAGPVLAQALPPAEDNGSALQRTSDPSVRAVSAPATSADEPRTAERIGTSPPSSSSSTAQPAKKFVARITAGNGTLPSDAGQVWREYDISPYTARITTTKRPEQAIIDWILRETGYEAWHTEPMGILSAGPRTLHVYHTPEMQKTVADVVDRFLSSEAAGYTFSLRVVTLDSPNWRTTAQRLLRSVPVQTPGINAWLLAKEDAAILLGEMHRRSDYREHSSPYLMVNNGQSTVVSTMRGRPYVRDIVLRPDTATGFDPLPGQIDEGLALDFSPLLSADRRMIDATIKCNVDQVEKMLPVMIDVPTQATPRQRTKIDVPQIIHYRFHERFRWPVDEVLLVRMGMVAMPIPVDGAPMVPGVPLPIGNSPARADLLVFIECKGQSTVATAPDGSAQPARTPQREAKNYRGRY